jgi:deoxynucleotide monophosphate kinase-like protein
VLIGLSGKAGAGKDTLGAALVDGYGFQRVAFADALKDAILAADVWVQWYDGFRRIRDLVAERGWDKVKTNPEVRRLLQNFGQGMRDQDGFVWCRLGMARADTLCAHGADVVITDVRYINEARAIRKRGGLLVRIERTGLESADEHVSETELDDWSYDALVYNDGRATPPGMLAGLLLEELASLSIL